MAGSNRVHDQWEDEDAWGVGAFARTKTASCPVAAVAGMDGARRFHVTSPFKTELPQARFGAILADPPWRYQNSTGKVAPEHRRLHRYTCLSTDEISRLQVADIAANPAHLYLWCPNAMLWEGLHVMRAWGFTYKTNIVWYKIRKDGGPDGRGVGFYFRNVTENLLFGVRGKKARTLAPGRRLVNLMASQKREHSRKPDEQYALIEACSPGPWIELFARGRRIGWEAWGDEA